MKEFKGHEILSDDDIKSAARGYIKAIGGLWDYEMAIHEDNSDEFARDIEKTIFEKLKSNGYKIVKGAQ